MKKIYISPVSVIYAVNTTEIIALSFSGDGNANPNVEVDTKEEKASGSGIWDLYN